MAGAEAEQKAAIAADPKNIMARTTLAQLYLRENDPAKAEATLHQAAEDLGDTLQGAELLQDFYVGTHQLDRSESVYADLVSKHPKSAPLKIVYARILISKKELAKARTTVDELMKSDGSDPNVAVLNGILLLNDHKPGDAVDVLQKAAKNNPESVDVKIWLARAAEAKGDMSLAQQSFQDAAKISPRNLEVKEGLAQIAIQRRDFTLLAQIADETIPLVPQSGTPYIWRGIAERNQNNYEKADADLLEAIKLNPKDSAAYLELGQLRLVQQKFPEARTFLDQALENNPNSARALRLLVALDLHDKQPAAKAIARVQAQIAKSPQNAEFYDQLSELQYLTGDSAAAVASAETALKLNPSDGAAVMALTHAQVAHGDAPKAIETWQKWATDHPKDAQAYAILGSLEEGQGNTDKATADYKKALEIDPDQPVASNNLAYLMVETGQNLDVALTLAQNARRGLPNSPNTADTLAWVYYHKGTYLTARDMLEEALKTAPNDASLHYHLGMTYTKLSDKASAETHLKKAVDSCTQHPGRQGRPEGAQLTRLEQSWRRSASPGEDLRLFILGTGS